MAVEQARGSSSNSTLAWNLHMPRVQPYKDKKKKKKKKKKRENPEKDRKYYQLKRKEMPKRGLEESKKNSRG